MIKPILFLALVTLYGCSDQMENIQKLDTSPEIGLVQNTELKSEIIDSIRFYSEEPFYYNVKLAVKDAKKNIWKLNYDIEKGEAKVLYDGNILSNIYLRVDLPEVLLSISPKTKGNINLLFTVQDRFENKKTAAVKLFVFDNLIPIANLAVTKISKNHPLEYTLDASASYDQDRNFGGRVVGYYFNVDGRNIESTSPKINYIFNSQGTFNLSVRVIDNNGEYSKPYEMKVDVN